MAVSLSLVAFAGAVPGNWPSHWRSALARLRRLARCDRFSHPPRAPPPRATLLRPCRLFRPGSLGYAPCAFYQQIKFFSLFGRANEMLCRRAAFYSSHLLLIIILLQIAALTPVRQHGRQQQGLARPSLLLTQHLRLDTPLPAKTFAGLLPLPCARTASARLLPAAVTLCQMPRQAISASCA